MHKNQGFNLVISNGLSKILFTNIICCGNMSIEARNYNQGIIYSRQYLMRGGYQPASGSVSDPHSYGRRKEERCEEIYRIPTVQGH